MRADVARAAPPPPAGDLVRALRTWRPQHTPRATLGVSLWLFGLYAALFAAAPSAITPAQEAAYERHMRVAESFHPARAEAAMALAVADARVEAAKTWFWRLRAEDAARVRALQAERAVAAAAAGRADADWARHVRAARSQLGVWSDAGVREARKQFWRAYENGKVFAQRHTFYDVFLMLLRRSEDENMFTFVIGFIFRVLANFTVGMISAVFAFVFALPALIWGFQPGLLSGLAFFCVAALGAAAVVALYLGALYGAAGGTVVLAARAAQAQARLQGGPSAQARRHHLHAPQGRHYD